MWGNIIIAFILAVLTSFVITPYTMRLAKKSRSIRHTRKEKSTYKTNTKTRRNSSNSWILVSVVYLLVILNWENVDIYDGQEYILKTIRIFNRNSFTRNNMLL